MGGADAPVPLEHPGVRVATQPRARGQPQRSVDPAPSAALRGPASSPSASPGAARLRRARWTGPFPDVEVRPLAGEEALVRQEVAP